jgi:hypothetical protein
MTKLVNCALLPFVPAYIVLYGIYRFMVPAKDYILIVGDTNAKI